MNLVFSDHIKAVTYTLIGVLLFSITTALVKYLSEENNIFFLLFFRNLVGFLFIYAIYMRKHGIRFPAPKASFSNHFIRAFLGFLATFALFQSFARLPLQDATVLTYSGPLFVTVLSFIFLKEKINSYILLSLVIGFCGVVLIAQPTGMVSANGFLFGMLAAFSNACALVIIKRIRKDESSLVITFYYLLIATVISTILLPFFWEEPGTFHILGILAMGLCSSLAHYCLAEGLHYAPASKVAPFNYTSLVWASLIGLVVWSEPLRTEIILGAGFIIASGLLILKTAPDKKTSPQKTEGKVTP